MFAVKAHHKIDLDVGHLWSRHIFCFIVYLCAFISTIILMLYDGAFVRREYDLSGPDTRISALPFRMID